MNLIQKNFFILALFTLLSSPSWAVELIASDSFTHQNCTWTQVSQESSPFMTRTIDALSCGAGEIARRDSVSHAGGTFCYVGLTDTSYSINGYECSNYSISGDLPEVLSCNTSMPVASGHNGSLVLAEALAICSPCDAYVTTFNMGQTLHGYCRD